MVRRIARLFLFGAIVITLFDGFHTYSATTEYADPWILKTAWWVPLLYGSASALGGLFYDQAYQRLGGPPRLPSQGQATNALFVFGLLYFASGFLPVSNVVKLVVLVGGSIVVWGMVDQTKQGVVLGVVVALAGCSAEIVLTRLGAFRHLQADVLGIPIWLPGLYLVAAPAVGQLSRRMLRDPATLYDSASY